MYFFKKDEEDKSEGENHMTCFGNYCDENGNLCSEGALGFCNYNEECKRNCNNY